MTTVRTVDATADVARAHLWPLGAPVTDDTRCTVCCVTWARHFAKPGCERAARCAHCGEMAAQDGMYSDPFGTGGDICGECSDHLDAKEWRKDELLDHMFAHDPGFYFTSSITKKMLVDWHLDDHRRAALDRQEKTR